MTTDGSDAVTNFRHMLVLNDSRNLNESILHGSLRSAAIHYERVMHRPIFSSELLQPLWTKICLCSRRASLRFSLSRLQPYQHCSSIHHSMPTDLPGLLHVEPRSISYHSSPLHIGCLRGCRIAVFMPSWTFHTGENV